MDQKKIHEKGKIIMNKHFKTFLLVIGGALLVSGSAIFAAGCKNVATKAKTREFDLTGQTIEKFDFDCDTSDIEFVATTDSTMKVVYKESEKVFHTEEIKDNTLFIKQTDNLKWYERVFTFDFAPKKATVYLPAAHFDSLKVDNSTGDIKIPHDFSFNSADIKLSTGTVNFNCNVTNETKVTTSTGDIHLKDVETKSLTVKRSTGDLLMEKISVTEAISIDGDTGKVLASDITASSLSIKSSTGDIKLNNTKVSGELFIQTSTGDIDFADLDFANGTIKTSTGNVEGTLATPKYIEAESNTGKIKIESDRTNPQTLKVTTSTGDIKISNK